VIAWLSYCASALLLFSVGRGEVYFPSSPRLVPLPLSCPFPAPFLPLSCHFLPLLQLIQTVLSPPCLHHRRPTPTDLTAAPNAMSRPTILSTTSTSATVAFAPPSSPNGIIDSYRVYYRRAGEGTGRNFTIGYDGPPDVLVAVIVGLSPATVYEFAASASTALEDGESALSETTEASTKEAGVFSFPPSLRCSPHPLSSSHAGLVISITLHSVFFSPTPPPAIISRCRCSRDGILVVTAMHPHMHIGILRAREVCSAKCRSPARRAGEPDERKSFMGGPVHPQRCHYCVRRGADVDVPRAALLRCG